MSSHVKLAAAISTIFAAGVGGAAFAQQPAPAAPNPAPHAAPPPHPPGTPPRGRRRGPQGLFQGLARLSPADRTAVIDARLAALKAGLELNADQQKNWQPFETAVRNGLDQAMKMHDQFANQGPPSDLMQRLERVSQMAEARATWLKNFVDAAKPLYDSLTPEQKARVPLLLGVAGRIGRFGPPARAAMGPPGGRRPGSGNVGMNRRERMGRERMNERGENGEGGQEDWRSRMRQRMEQMNRTRREWRGDQNYDGGRDYGRGQGYDGGRGDDHGGSNGGD